MVSFSDSCVVSFFFFFIHVKQPLWFGLITGLPLWLARPSRIRPYNSCSFHHGDLETTVWTLILSVILSFLQPLYAASTCTDFTYTIQNTKLSEVMCSFVASEGFLTTTWNTDSASSNIGWLWHGLRYRNLCPDSFLQPSTGPNKSKFLMTAHFSWFLRVCSKSGTTVTDWGQATGGSNDKCGKTTPCTHWCH